MAKKKEEIIPGPDPLPKAGDTVNYVWPENKEPITLANQVLTAKVVAVYDGFDGRLCDLEVDGGKGPIVVKSAPWRDDAAGNTWHYPA